MYGRVRAGLLALAILAVLIRNFAAAQSAYVDVAEPTANPTSLPPTPPARNPNPGPGVAELRAFEPAAPNLRAHWSIYPGTFAMPQMAHAAGMIFSGTVTAIARAPARNQPSTLSVKTVSITFRVDQAIRGTSPGQDLTIRQWIGMWTNGQRYQVGEHVLLFLYPPSKLGLTSCVGGPLGRFSLDFAGQVMLSAQHLAAFRSDPILGGKSHALVSDFAEAVRRASAGEFTR
jgi:hypothetical protein